MSTISDHVQNGLENVLIVYGDPYPEPRPRTFEFSKTSDLIREVSLSNNGRGPCIGAVTNQHTNNREKEVSRTISKVEAGADYVITNVAFDSESVLDHRDSLLDAGLEVPLFIQVSIPVGLDNVLFVGRKFGIPVPANVQRKLASDPIEGSFAVATEAYESLYREASGIHFSFLFRHRNPIPTYHRLLATLGAGPNSLAPLIASSSKTHRNS